MGPCFLDPPLPPPGPVQAVIIGLAGSELHYLPWPTPACGGAWRLRAGETGRREEGVPTIPWPVGTNKQLGLPLPRGRQSTSSPSRSVPALAPAPQPTWCAAPGCPLPMGTDMPPKSSRWVSLEAQIFQLILQDLMGKALPLLSLQQMGWQPGAWGRVRGLFSPGNQE